MRDYENKAKDIFKLFVGDFMEFQENDESFFEFVNYIAMSSALFMAIVVYTIGEISSKNDDESILKIKHDLMNMVEEELVKFNVSTKYSQ